MSSSLKILFCSVLTFFFLSNLNAQSKKEQIVVLSNKIDSLNSVIENEREAVKLKESAFNLKVDSINAKLIVLNNELVKISNDFQKRKIETDALNTRKKTIETELTHLKEENSKLYFKLDSLSASNLKIEIVFVEGGTFQMGSNSIFLYEKPIHSVSLNSYNIGKYEVTQAQWKAVVGNNPSYYKDCDDCPVESVTWFEVQDFIRRLNAQTDKNYRLPTEAEWEYAAKGGKNSNGYSFSGSDNLNLVAWYGENSGGKTHVVGSKRANELGVHDMAGNVFEWCSDWFGEYSGLHQINPLGALPNECNVLRGGGLTSGSVMSDCRTSARMKYSGSLRNSSSGFRLVLPISE